AVAVEILDEGPGIPESSLARLFEPMADIGNSPTDGEPSTGVGLPVIADIVHRHGGEVWGRNRQGGGAAFGFSLPILSDKDSEPLTWSMS
ncbi:MAG: two-component sensor histidine kinase, partial [Proteobacteria bacterium]|nr:two-component sensor histidine kinase [Pseudomonadota bacterium]